MGILEDRIAANRPRAERAEKALTGYAEAGGEPHDICQLIVDLLHLAKEWGEESAGDIFEEALMHYHAEQLGE